MSEHGPTSVPGERSDEERERARLEREARRRGRDDGDDLFVQEHPPEPRTPRVRRTREPGTPNVMARRILALVLIAVVGVAAWFLISLFQPFGGDGSGSVTVTIPKGASVGEIGRASCRERV